MTPVFRGSCKRFLHRFHLFVHDAEVRTADERQASFWGLRLKGLWACLPSTSGRIQEVEPPNSIYPCTTLGSSLRDLVNVMGCIPSSKRTKPKCSRFALLRRALEFLMSTGVGGLGVGHKCLTCSIPRGTWRATRFWVQSPQATRNPKPKSVQVQAVAEATASTVEASFASAPAGMLRKPEDP